MKAWADRAMQISILNEDQIKRLHDLETICGFAIPNWNIQEIFNISTIKETHDIPFDEELLRLHLERIQKEIRLTKLLPENGYGLAWVHALDSEIAESGFKITWPYAGP